MGVETYRTHRLALQHQDLVRRRVADPDAAVRAARQAVDFGTFDPPFIQQLAIAWVEAEDATAVRLGHAEAVVTLVPEHTVRARRLEGKRPQQFTRLGIDVLDLVCAWPADPQRATGPRPSVQQPGGRGGVQLGLLRTRGRRLFAGLVWPPLQTVHPAFS